MYWRCFCNSSSYYSQCWSFCDGFLLSGAVHWTLSLLHCSFRHKVLGLHLGSSSSSLSGQSRYWRQPPQQTMDEIFFNSTDDNVTSSWNVSSLLRERSRMSADQLYACNLYKFVMSGVVQLIVSIIGFVGKSIKQKPFRNIIGRSLRKR